MTASASASASVTVAEPTTVAGTGAADLAWPAWLGGSPLDGAVASVSAAPSPSPSPNLQQGIDPGDVSPGLLGFLPVFAIALVCLFLFRSLTTKLRKVNHRQALLDADAAAAADAVEADAAAASAAGGTGAPRASGDDPDDVGRR